jgi:cytochrome c-type protein NapC
MPQTPQQHEAGGGGGRSWFGRVRAAISGYPLLFVLLALVVGAVVAVPTTEAVDRYFSTDKFCAEACHSMAGTVAVEAREATHWKTPTGVRARCADCHVSEGLTLAMWDHFLGTSDLIAFLFEGVRTPEDFEEVRAEAAHEVRMAMLDNDSKHCRSCHVMEAIQPERRRGQNQHAEAQEEGTTCIACHYNLVHKDVEPSQEFLDAIDG